MTTATAGTLFRNNSVATHMMTAYSKAVGLPYLKNTIGMFAALLFFVQLPST
jgi:hypothetical protein